MRPVRTPPAHPSAARARGLPRIPRLPPCKWSTEDAGAPTLQDAIQGCRSTRLARCYPRMPQLRPAALRPLPRADGTPRTPEHPPVPTGRRDAEDAEAPVMSACKPAVEDAEAPTGGPGRLPATRDAKAPLETLESMDAKASLETLDTSRSTGDVGHRGVPGDAGVLEAQMEALGVLGHLRGPWRPWDRWGASGAPEPIIAKTVFGACLKITDS